MQQHLREFSSFGDGAYLLKRQLCTEGANSLCFRALGGRDAAGLPQAQRLGPQLRKSLFRLRRDGLLYGMASFE